jgi:co-chaperonin GroES (HSP10)
MIIPNTHRVIIKPIPIEQLKSSGLVLAGQLKAGENLFYGKVVHPGDTKFKEGQEVFYSEYSAANLFDVKPLIEGTKSFADMKDEGYVVVASDDVMAYYDTSEVSTVTKKD